MADILIAAHHDDETLFAAYTVLRHQPVVITVCSDATYQQKRYGITSEERRGETARALWWMGSPEWHELGVSDENPNWAEAVLGISRVANGMLHVGRVFAPLAEEGGHEHHNQVSEIASEMFTDVSFYSTYRRGHGRSQVGELVEAEPGWPAMKFRAMACYGSQINLGNTRPWFSDWDKEWLS